MYVPSNTIWFITIKEFPSSSTFQFPFPLCALSSPHVADVYLRELWLRRDCLDIHCQHSQLCAGRKFMKHFTHYHIFTPPPPLHFSVDALPRRGAAASVFRVDTRRTWAWRPGAGRLEGLWHICHFISMFVFSIFNRWKVDRCRWPEAWYNFTSRPNSYYLSKENILISLFLKKWSISLQLVIHSRWGR